MRQYPRIPWLLLVVAVLVISATAAESAKSLYNKGRQLEARQDYINAFEAFRQAYDQKPTELKYRIAYQRTRFLAAAAHVNKGQELREAGKLDEALAEFEYAAKVDPSSFIAIQEARRTKALIDAKSGAQPTPPPQAISPTSKRLEEAAGPVELAPVSNQPITLEISNDSKIVFETIGKLAGINVLFDPDYVSRRVTLKLNGVSLQEALAVLAFNSGTFWRPVTPNTIFVAANNKRKDLDQNVLKTFYLSNISTPTDLQDIGNALRSILEFQKVQVVNSQNAIIVRGTPDQVALAEKVIGDIDKSKPEVIVEVAIMQVRRDKLRNLGIQPPASASVALTGPTTSTTTTPTTTTTGTTTTPTAGNVTLNTFNNLKATDFAVTLPGATANFLFTDSDSKLIQNPQIRGSDGQKASLKIGDRIPIATGSIGNPIGGGFNASAGLVNTQFQYIDVGVNIDITPRVFQGREVGLKLALDVSSVSSFQSIGGINQPVISQKKVEHDIRLKEGEVNVLGGIFEQTDTKTINGLPGLAQLPFLRYLFSSENHEVINNEIVFVLIPHIVRGQELSDLNQRTIDVGTGTSLELRRLARPPASSPPATSAPQTPVPPKPPTVAPTQPQSQLPNGSQPNTGQQPGGQQQGTAPVETASAAAPNTPAASAPTTSLLIDPPNLSPAPGSTFTVNVMVAGAKDMYSAPMQISYDPSLLQFMNVANGDLLSRDGQAVALVHREDAGSIQANATRPPGSGGISGDGVIYTLTFKAKGAGTTSINIRPSVRNNNMQVIPVSVSPAVISVK